MTLSVTQPVESYGWEHRNCGISGYEYGTGYGKFYSRGLKKFTSSKLKTAKYVCEWCQTGVDKLFPEKKIGKSDMICKSCLDYINNYVEY
jgi:hypothetical protein